MKALNIVVIDVAERSVFTDYMIVIYIYYLLLILLQLN